MREAESGMGVGEGGKGVERVLRRTKTCELCAFSIILARSIQFFITCGTRPGSRQCWTKVTKPSKQVSSRARSVRYSHSKHLPQAPPLKKARKKENGVVRLGE